MQAIIVKVPKNTVGETKGKMLCGFMENAEFSL